MRTIYCEARQEHDAETAATTWNDQHQVGMAVIVTKDDGSTITTTTRSRAWNLCGTAVVMVKGIVGGYMLERVRPVAS